MNRRASRRVFFLVVIFLLMPVTWTRRGAAAETCKPLHQRLRRLDQQFKRFQQMTFTHLQSIAEKYNISHNIDSRFQVLSRQFERISRELRAFKETTEHSLNSLKSWTKSLQKKTKKLDSSLANMTRALRENNHLNLRQIQKQRTVLSDLSHKIQKQRSHISSLESLRNQVQHGMQDLQASLKRHQAQITKMESQMQGLLKIISASKEGGLDPLNSIRKQQGVVLRHVQPKPKSEENRIRDRLPSGPTEQPQTYKMLYVWQSTIQPTVQAEEELFQLPLRHKIPHIQTPKEEARICNVGSMLLFPSASTENHVTFQRSFQTGIHELSICTWLKVDAKYLGTILSYATENNDNMLVLYGRNSGILGVMNFVIGDPAYRELSLQNILDGHWHHLCIIWSSIEGRFWYYLDSHLISPGSKFQKGYEIPPGGSMILGQEQDSIGGDFDETEAFVGRLAGFALWTRSLSPGEVSGLASGKGVPRGAVLSLDDVDQMFGSVQHITCECLEHCM
ncbi:pentraxin-4 [Sinocyclocheilus grahami]|uniref:pentraxin-4 n=1 Tax=Sinocyclocheilus grahami TaxID=75366 RepID=UPI0007ACDDC1|nr:PREDICTED: pentraxin-4-like [Sinocyclocheilus grahami]